MNTQDPDVVKYERQNYINGIQNASSCVPVARYECRSKLQLARERHGKPFAFETGATWKPRQVPLLTEWLQSRGRDVK
jgi:hypothetical protein